MKKLLSTALVAAFFLTACAVVPAPRHSHHGPGGVVVVPYLPPVVILDVEPYYVQDGFYYHYDRGRWYYARSKRGPWADLPRDHYPKEVRYKGKRDRHDRDRDRDDRRYD